MADAVEEAIEELSEYSEYGRQNRELFCGELIRG
jgi:hypothetical protein